MAGNQELGELAWLRLTARGTAGHGSMIHQDNAVTELAGAVARIGRHRWPAVLTPTVTAFLTRVTPRHCR